MITPNDPTESAPITPFPATDSHLYLIEDGERWWYAARDESHALAQHAEQCGVKPENLYFEYPNMTIKQIPDDHELTVRDYDEPESGNERTMTAREWVAELVGEGIVATTVEY